MGFPVYAVDSDVEREPREADHFVSPITVSTQPRTADDKGDVVSGCLRVNNGKNLERREEAENVDQIRADSRLGSQDPAETPRGNVQDCIVPQGEHPNGATNVLEPNMQHGEGVRQSLVATRPADVSGRVENLKPIKSPGPYLDLLTSDARRVESEARSKLQAEAEGDEGYNEVIDTPDTATDSNGLPRSTLFPPLGRMLSLLDGVGPPRSVGVFGKAITRRPRRPIGGRRSSKLIQTQPPVEVESEWHSEGTSNVNARPGAGASKSDDLSFFVGV